MFFSDLLFPIRCLYCLKRDSYICERCYRNFKRTLPECFICRRISSKYRTHDECFSGVEQIGDKPENLLLSTHNNEIDTLDVTILWQYDPFAKELMREAKYAHSTEIFKSIDELLLKRLKEIDLPFQSHDKIHLVPIPSHPSSLNRRGFNQTELICNCLSDVLNSLGYRCEIQRELIFKTRKTSRQASLDKSSRESNLKDSFSINHEKFREMDDGSILLVDDVVTTGSTMIEVFTTLRNGSIERKIEAVALFRGSISSWND